MWFLAQGSLRDTSLLPRAGRGRHVSKPFPTHSVGGPPGGQQDRERMVWGGPRYEGPSEVSPSPGQVRRGATLQAAMFSYCVGCNTGSDLEMGREAPGRRAWVAPIHPAFGGGEQVPSSHTAATPPPLPRAGRRRAGTWLLSKVDSAQSSLIVEALLKIATLRRRLCQGRVGRDNLELRACWGRS